MVKTATKPAANTNDVSLTHYIENKNLFITPKGRGQFVALSKKFKSKDAAADDTGAYCLSLLFPPDVDLTLLRAEAERAGKEKFGVAFSYTDPKKCKGKKTPFLDPVEKGTELLDEAGEEVDLAGWTLIRFNTYAAQPTVRDGTKPGNPKIDPDEIGVECYSGRWYRLMTRAKAYDIGGGVGVKFYLEGVQALMHDAKTSSFSVGDDGEDFGAPDLDGDGI